MTIMVFPAEYVGMLPYENGTVRIGDLEINDCHGYCTAAVYVRRQSGHGEGITVREIIISFMGDGYAQEALDAENEEAMRFPLGPREYWRAKEVGSVCGDGHVITNEEFDAEWDAIEAEGEE